MSLGICLSLLGRTLKERGRPELFMKVKRRPHRRQATLSADAVEDSWV